MSDRVVQAEESAGKTAPDKPETQALGRVRGPVPAADERHQRADGRSRRHPQTTDGQDGRARWSGSAACLEEVCGSCTMVINGKVRQAC